MFFKTRFVKQCLTVLFGKESFNKCACITFSPEIKEILLYFYENLSVRKYIYACVNFQLCTCHYYEKRFFHYEKEVFKIYIGIKHYLIVVHVLLLKIFQITNSLKQCIFDCFNDGYFFTIIQFLNTVSGNERGKCVAIIKSIIKSVTKNVIITKRRHPIPHSSPVNFSHQPVERSFLLLLLALNGCIHLLKSYFFYSTLLKKKLCKSGGNFFY